jgi:hypothetical protein
MTALVVPHEGHAIPVIFLKKHGLNALSPWARLAAYKIQPYATMQPKPRTAYNRFLFI